MAQTASSPKTSFMPICALVSLALLLIGLDGTAVAKSKTAEPGGKWVKSDRDRDGLTNESEVKRTRTKPDVADTDRDGLADGVEVNRTKTNPRRADSDGDRLGDGLEVNRYRTNPRQADSDGDGVNDGAEVRAGTDPLRAPSGPATPPPITPPAPPTSPWIPPIFMPTPPADTTAPETTISAGPSGSTTATGAELSFSSSEPGSSFECKLDSGGFAACGSPKTYSGLAVGSHTFSVRATDAAGNTDASPATRAWTIAAEEPGPGPDPDPDPDPGPDPDPTDGCVPGATAATTAAAVTSAVSSGKNVCVTAAVGNLDFANMGKKAVTISTEGSGSMGQLEINSTTDLTISNARLRSVTLRGAHRTTIENSTMGGTQANRVYDQIIFMPDENNDVTIRNNDIGWAKADNSGNTGYGCRCYGTLNRLKFVGNRLHDLAGDGFQGVGGSDVLIDRNEIGPVGANPDSNEHSDNIQITYNGPNLRITNNWIHHQGFYEGKNAGNSGSIYIHGGTSNSLLLENNLVQTNQGRSEICGLGTGGTSRSNITIRNNTWVDGGLAFTGFPGFEWDCDSGSGNTIERNIAVDPDGGFAQNGAAATITGNLWGQPSLITLDAEGNCTSSNCNPGSGPIGYRKPSGVAW